MSWFGGSSSNNNNDKKTDSYESNYDTSASNNSIEYSSPNNTNTLEQEIMKAQEQMAVQSLMLKIAEIGFDNCITSKPSTSLSYSEKSCLSNVVDKYFSTTEFVVEKISKGA